MSEPDPTEEELARTYLAGADGPHATVDSTHLQAPSEFAEQLRQQILEIYGFDQMTPAERAKWDAYGAAVEELRRREQAFIESAQETGRRFAEELSALTGVTLAFAFEGTPEFEQRLAAAELAPALANPLVQAALADPELKKAPRHRCSLVPFLPPEGEGVAK